MTTKKDQKKYQIPETGADFNMVEDVIYRRRSVRLYKEKQVPEYLVRRIVEAGRFAPSAGNAQTWKYIVVRNPIMIAEMTAYVVTLCKRFKKIADYLEPGMGKKEWRSKLLARLKPGYFHPIPQGAMWAIADGKLSIWHGAPTVILLLADTRSPGDPSIDIGVTGQNMILTAHSFGLGTCWVSFASPLSKSVKWRKRLGIRYPYTLLTSIALGYPRGIPDEYVTRETHAIDWFAQDGTFRVVY